jgi:uncharacterized protein involved in outer membrane biogenesis
MTKLKKSLLIAGGIIVLIVLLISPITKYLIEKYDVEYTGREITLDWAYVNPFTGYVHLDDLVIYEHESDEAFLSMKGLSANLSMHKLLSKTYEITKVKLKKPVGYVIQNEKDFNFSDLIERFSSDSTKEKTNEVVRFNLLNIKIVDGEFHYAERQTPVNYFIKNVNIDSEGLRYDVDTLPIHFSFSSGLGPCLCTQIFTGDLLLNL